MERLTREQIADNQRISLGKQVIDQQLDIAVLYQENSVLAAEIARLKYEATLVAAGLT